MSTRFHGMITGDRRRPVDVAIVGAGPAGSSVAIRLADSGLSVLLVESGAFESARIGESMAPSVQPLLRELHAWDEVLSTDPLPSWGTTSLWREREVDTHSHLISPYQQGWHVDRRAFDEAIARVAARSGADLLCDARVRTAVHRPNGWHLDIVGQGIVRAGVLVDATGRSGRFARSLGAERMVFDHLVGVGRTWSDAPAEDNRVVIEATPDGWWYSAPLPGHGLVTLLMTDADICRRRRLTSPDPWSAALGLTELTAARLGDASPGGPIRSHASNSGRLLRADRLPWIAVGDAALAVDPLTGSGVTRSLRMSASAAQTIIELQSGKRARQDAAIVDHEAGRNRECQSYLHERLDYYAAGPGFDAPFWTRRRDVARRRVAQ